MPVSSPSFVGLAGSVSGGTYPNPPTADITAVYTFNFGSWSISDYLRIIVVSFGGTSVTDSKGNTFILDASGGTYLKVFSALVTSMPVRFVDTITVHGGSTGFQTIVLSSTDPVNYLGPVGSGGAGFDNQAAGASGVTGTITLPEPEDLLLGAAAWDYQKPFPGSFFNISPTPPPDGLLPVWQAVGAIANGTADSIGPPRVYDTYVQALFLLDPSFHTPAVGPWTFGGPYTYSIIPPPNNSTVDSALLIVAYRGLGALPPPPPESPATAGDGQDLVVSAVGLHRAFRSGSDVKVQRWRFGATDWDEPFVIASDADSSANFGAAPCLCIDNFENLLCWYHTAEATTFGYRSDDYGDHWSVFYAAHDGWRYPKLAWAPDGLLLAYFNGDNLNIAESQNGGITTTLAVTFAAQPKQRIGLGVDQDGITHAVWEDAGGNIIHRASKAPGQLGSWSDPEIIASGIIPAKVPGYAIGHRRAMVVWFEAPTDAEAGLLDSTYGALDAIVAPPIPDGADPLLWAGFFPAYPGLCYDVFDGLWLLVRYADTGHPLLLIRTQDDGATWQQLNAGGFGP